MGYIGWLLVAFALGLLLGPFVKDQIVKLQKKND